MANTLKAYHDAWGWIVQWLILAGGAYLVLLGDSLWVSHAQLDDKFDQLNRAIEHVQLREDINREQIAELRMLTARLTVIAERLERKIEQQ
ncbi:MAG: hypothetical protein JJU00_20090 [Opitutales bacterium]|nr:hypothetical protein [Opitutales bacterium]